MEQDHERRSIESRVLELKRKYQQVIGGLCVNSVVLQNAVPATGCFRTAPEGNDRVKRNASCMDCFLRLYRKISALDPSGRKLLGLERQVLEMKREVDELWERHLIKAVKDIAEAIRIEPVLRDPDARADAAQDILARVYGRTLLQCLLSWRGEGQGVFTNYLRAAVANVKATYERELWRRISREELPGELPEREDTRNSFRDLDNRLTIKYLMKEFKVRAAGTREADVFFLHYEAELPHKEIAERLQISEEYSRLLLHRAIEIIRRCAGLASPASGSSNVRIAGKGVIAPSNTKGIAAEVFAPPGRSSLPGLHTSPLRAA